jgi:flagellar hook-associated protein 1 FlgK
MSGLFSTLNISKGAMFAQQQQVNVTSHNIANAGTAGFSRQHLILQTGRPQTVTGAGQVGTGVVVSEVQRARNIFLDYQIRKEATHKGNYDVREQYLGEIESVFNEPSDTGISKLMSKFFDGWQKLSTNAEKSDARTVVGETAKALADEINHTYKKLNDIKTNSKNEIQQSLFDINNIFDQLNSINDEIITVTVAGNNPNDLMDRRDLLLDQLSTKFGINTKNTTYSSMIVKPEGLDVDLIDYNGSTPTSKLGFVNDMSYDSATNTATVTYYKNGDMTSDKNKVTVTINGISQADYDNLNKTRAIWTDANGNVPGANETSPGSGVFTMASYDSKVCFAPASGQLGGVISIYKDADDYIGQLNTLAKAIAYSVNAIHMEGYDTATPSNSIPFFVAKDDPIDFKNIDASNIKVNGSILKDPMKIQTGESKTSGSTDGKRALALAQLRDLTFNIQDIKADTSYKEFLKMMINNGTIEGAWNENGTPADILDDTYTITTAIPTTKGAESGMKVEAYFKNSINKLGVQSQEAQRIVKNQEVLLQGLVERRASVSGVSLDEEMVNLVQFQHAYQANAKMISTVDQLLDVVINGLKR